MCAVCDCCIQSTILVCEIYLYIYIAVCLVFIALVLTYRYFSSKMQQAKSLKINVSQSPDSSLRKKTQSKSIIVVSVIIWNFSRILYFSIVYLNSYPTEPFICSLELLQNLPVLMMYICFIVFHRFLLNLYMVMHQMDIKKRLRQVSVYFWTMALVYTVSQVISTSIVCAEPLVLLG